MDWATITAIIDTEIPSDCPVDVEEINYYGSGCGNEKNCQLVSAALQRRFPMAAIHVSHDLMAAAHGLCGHEKGIACILGTGANSCLYDGKNIVNTGCCYFSKDVMGHLIDELKAGNNPIKNFSIPSSGIGAQPWLAPHFTVHIFSTSFEYTILSSFLRQN